MHADLLLTPVSRAGIWPLCFIRTDRPGSSGAGRRANLPPVVRVCGDSPVARRRARRRGPNGRQGFAPSSVRPCSLPLCIISREAAKRAKFGHGWRQSPSRLRVLRVRPAITPTHPQGKVKCSTTGGSVLHPYGANGAPAHPDNRNVQVASGRTKPLERGNREIRNPRLLL